jgi:lipopolysaccharide export system protein LptC
MSWRGPLTLLLLLAAAITGWSVWTERPGHQVTAPASDAHSDYLLHDFELVALDAQGRESFTLRAPRLTRNASDRTMDLRTPRFLIPPRPGTDGSAWEVRARTGWVSAEGDELRLRGGVDARSTAASAASMRMTTEQLNVYPRQQRATSAAEVTIVQPGLILRGRGLEADLADNRLRLQSNVKAHYARTPR